jgi:dienelactone hydrolase
VLRLALVLALVLPAAATAAPYTVTTGSGPDVVVAIHGGGWSVTGRSVTDDLAMRTGRFARWGDTVVSTDYAPGGAGLADVLATYDAARAARPSARICLYGESAGGQWALMVAALRPTVDCVIAAAAPADLVASSPTLAPYVLRAFGSQLSRYSPSTFASRIAAPILLEYATDDVLVPPSQGTLVQSAAPDAATVLLRPGTRAWVHTAVSKATLRAAHRRERTLLS